jgi:RimJ/RimL family protein N-acetyltransferase
MSTRPPESMETDRLLLRMPALTDAEAIFTAYGQDTEVTKYLTWRPHESIRQSERFVAGCIVAWESGGRFPWAIALKGADKPAGMIEIRVDGFKAEVGYVLARPHWGQGLMTEAARRVVNWALSQPEVYRVWAYCDVVNLASARVLEKAGMQHEGILRRYAVHPNVSDLPRDCHSYAVVK